jgi:hypothetical protein
MAKLLPFTNPDYVLELTGQTVNLLHCDFATTMVSEYVSNSKILQSGGSVTGIYSGDGSQWLDLGFYPVKTVTSVVMDGNTLVADTDYLTPAQHGEADGFLYSPNNWNNTTRGNILVQFTYDTAAEMETIRFVSSMVAAYIKNQIFTNVKSETIGTYSVQYVTDAMIGNTQIDRYMDMLPRHFSIGSVGAINSPQDIRNTLYNQYDINYYANGLN